jgi:hypothetical protein
MLVNATSILSLKKKKFLQYKKKRRKPLFFVSNLKAFQVHTVINVLLVGLLASTVISLFTLKSLNQMRKVHMLY